MHMHSDALQDLIPAISAHHLRPMIILKTATHSSSRLRGHERSLKGSAGGGQGSHLPPRRTNHLLISICQVLSTCQNTAICWGKRKLQTPGNDRGQGCQSPGGAGAKRPGDRTAEEGGVLVVSRPACCLLVLPKAWLRCLPQFCKALSAPL